ncbi:MAG: glycosyltransferase family 4 protein [Candidatus Omnitrophica bacterium]|nr:glycosyltransferase family 4 protein [Candidatus Omnitrophota bacterium]
MRILFVVAKALKEKNEVSIFFRVKNPKEKEYSLTYKRFDEIETYAINHTFRHCGSFHDTYCDEAVDKGFVEVLDRVRPDIVHIHHLLFLSHGIVKLAKERNIPIVYTLHDYWLLCYRGQLLRDDMAVCIRPSVDECRKCLRYLLGIRKHTMYLYGMLRNRIPPFILGLLKKVHLISSGQKPALEIKRWQDSLAELRAKIDLFIAPSCFVGRLFIAEGFSERKMLFSANGINSQNFEFTPKTKSNKLRFGYLGTLLPAKGVDVLIEAFKGLASERIELAIYGAFFAYAGFEYYPRRLRKMAKADKRIKFMGGYNHCEVGKILANIDVLIVPSLWLENAPLVVQEAFLSKTAVIASRIGGIPEFIKDGINGLLFDAGDIKGLTEKMRYLIGNPETIARFQENMPQVKSIEENAREMERVYSSLTNEKHG